jgi:hypothetical protein
VKPGVLRFWWPPPEAAYEIRRTQDSAREAALEAVLSHSYPLVPTRVPRSGTARCGLPRPSTREDQERLAAVGFLKDGQDRNLMTNAAGYGCDVFVTREGEMATRKVNSLEAQLGGMRVVRPEVFWADLKAGRESGT